MELSEKGVLERIADSLERIAASLDIVVKKLPAVNLQENMETTAEKAEKTNPSTLQKSSSSQGKQNIRIFSEYDGVEFIRDFFSDYGAIIKDYKKVFETDYDQIAKFIGEKYEFIEKLYKELRQSIANGCEKRTLDLLLTNSLHLGHICQLGELLDDYQFFAEYNYYKSPLKRMDFKHTTDREKINFINGHWLESYVHLKMIEELNALKTSLGIDFQFTILKNIKLKLEGGKEAEFDIILEVNQNVFWLEAKSENMNKESLNKHFKKYDDYSRIFRMGPEKMFVVHTNPQNSYINLGSKSFPDIRILNHKEFPGVIRDVVKKVL
jgi:hypothetical protein